MMHKVVSGGQTGVDRAALDVALALGIPCGGWCPQGRLAEDGVIAPHYPLLETETADYACRTERNVRDSDGTLILARSLSLEGGTALTEALARMYKKPVLVVDLTQAPEVEPVRAWLQRHAIGVLNVAGPRESQPPGVYREAAAFLHRLLAADRSPL